VGEDRVEIRGEPTPPPCRVGIGGGRGQQAELPPGLSYPTGFGDLDERHVGRAVVPQHTGGGQCPSPEPPIVFLISPVSSRVTLPNGESGDLACDDTAGFQLRRHELLSDQTDRIRELQQPV